LLSYSHNDHSIQSIQTTLASQNPKDKSTQKNLYKDSPPIQ
jgi:hypothetical protein